MTQGRRAVRHEEEAKEVEGHRGQQHQVKRSLDRSIVADSQEWATSQQSVLQMWGTPA